MKKFLIFILASGFWLLTPPLHSQTPISTDRLTAQSVEIVTPALTPVSQVSAFVVGNSGPATYYYWIVANFPQGNASPSPYVLIMAGPNVLSGSNYIRINWTAIPGATSYDVLRTTTTQLLNGAASIAVATGVAGVTTDDTGGALASYTIATLQPGRVSLRFQSPFANLLGSTQPPVSALGQARFYYDLAASQMMLSVNGGAYAPFGSGAGAGITSLNGVSAQTQFMVTCTTGTDFTIQPDPDTNSFCIPDASATARGLVTTGAQIFGGNKTFDGDTLMDGDLYVTGFFSTDHPIEGAIFDSCEAAEANTWLFCVDPNTNLPSFSADGSTPTPIITSQDPTVVNGLYTGGGVVWTGTGLNFVVSPATYGIAGVQYASALTSLTLSAADPGDPRFDLVVVDDTGVVDVIIGTPAANPAVPAYDPTSQIPLPGSPILINAGALIPGNVTQTAIYLENTEWTCAEVSPIGTINLASTNNPYQGTVDIEATAVRRNDYFECTAASPVALPSYAILAFYLRSKATWASQRSLVLSWYLSTAQVGNSVTLNNGAFGFVSSQTSAYQQMVAATSLFGAVGNVDRFRVTVAGGGSSTIGFYIDNIVLQAMASFQQPGAQPYDVAIPIAGLPDDGATLPVLTFTRAVSFAANFNGSAGTVGTNPTGAVDFTVKKGATTIGTIHVTTGGVVTFTTTGGASVSFAGGDRLTITNPTPQDATLADAAFTISGTR